MALHQVSQLNPSAVCFLTSKKLNLRVVKNTYLSFFTVNIFLLQSHSLLKLISFTEYFFTLFKCYLPLLKPITSDWLTHCCHCCFFYPGSIWKSEELKCRFKTSTTNDSCFPVKDLINYWIKRCGFLSTQCTDSMPNGLWIAMLTGIYLHQIVCGALIKWC